MCGSGRLLQHLLPILLLAFALSTYSNKSLFSFSLLLQFELLSDDLKYNQNLVWLKKSDYFLVCMKYVIGIQYRNVQKKIVVSFSVNSRGPKNFWIYYSFDIICFINI
jgi:hypothetical protein